MIAGLILAAGVGSRAAALSALRPKPCFPLVGSTPFGRAASALRLGGVSRVVANAFHRAEDVAGLGRLLDVGVEVEKDGPRGTAGGLAAVAPHLAGAEAVVIWNGDIVADVDVRALHAALGRDDSAVLAVRGELEPGVGNVGIDDEGRVVRLRTTSFGKETRSTQFAAIHLLRGELAARAPSRGCLIDDLYLPAIARGETLRTLAYVGCWHDVGDPKSYLEACLDELGSRDSGDSFVDVDAKCEGDVRLEKCALESDARVVGKGVLSQAIVWPGVTARAPRSRVIFAAEDVVIDVGS